jgi:putative inorganic carbon (hco3(-)) transporter
VIAFAALTGPVPKLGIVLVALLAAVVLVARDQRTRAFATLGALIVSPPLLLATIWNSPKLSIVHRHPLEAVALGVIAVLVVVAVAFVFDRHPSLVAMLAVAALPFRIPISSGGTTNDLLVPLYLVVGAGSLAFAVRALRGEPALGGNVARPPGWLERLLALYVVLYGVQATYSPGAMGVLPSGFQAALQNVVFFYVPFALLYRLLVGLEWNAQLIRRCVQVVAVVALACAAIAFFEYATKHTYFSTRLADQNQLYTYFVANSVFRDPNIFARFIALVMIVLSALLLYKRPSREQAVVGGVLALLWIALVISFSRSSMLALLVGLGLLAANKWRPTRALIVVAIVVVIGAAAVAVSPTTFGLNQGLNGVSAGRGSVLKGGIKLFGHRPVWGFGSGSFENEYARHYLPPGSTLTASHTIPVTVAAEQGVIGELVYLALVLVAVVGLLRGSGADPARAAVAAAFIALLVHTMLYADFLEDPFTWALLAVGMALARSSRPAGQPATLASAEAAPVPA